jgi:hypothetical protein
VCRDCGECNAWIECTHRVQKPTVLYKYPRWSGPGQRDQDRELEDKIKAAKGDPKKELEAKIQAAEVTWHPVVLSLELGAMENTSVALMLHSLHAFHDSPAAGNVNDEEDVATADLLEDIRDIYLNLEANPLWKLPEAQPGNGNRKQRPVRESEKRWRSALTHVGAQQQSVTHATVDSWKWAVEENLKGEAFKALEGETLTVEFKSPRPVLAGSLHLEHHGCFAAKNEDMTRCKNCGKAERDHIKRGDWKSCGPKMFTKTGELDLESEIRKCATNLKHKHHTLHVRRIDIHRCRPRRKPGDDYEWAKFPKNGACQSTSAEEWTVLQTALNTHALNAKYRETQARLINTPYRSDLDKWLLPNCCPSTESGSYLKQVLDKWDDLTIRTTFASVPGDTGDTGQSTGSSQGENEDGAAGLAIDGELPAENGERGVNRVSIEVKRSVSMATISRKFSQIAEEASGVGFLKSTLSSNLM